MSNRTNARMLWLLLASLALTVTVDRAANAQQVPQIPAFLPMSTAVPKTQAMPIDGTWTVSTLGKRIRIEAGRAFAVDPWTHLFVLNVQPGMVVLKDIQPAAPGKYAGQDLPMMGGFQATVSADGALDVSVSGLVPARYRLVPVTLDNQAWFNQEMQNAGLTPPAGAAPPAHQPPAYQPPAYQPPGQAPPAQQPPAYQPPPVAAGGQPAPQPPPQPYQPAAPGSPPAPQSGHVDEQAHAGPRSQGDAMLGPPTITCGHVGEAACEGSDGRVGAVYTRKAEWWGCPNESKSEGGRKIYFTPHNGGECWACPDGYRRTIKPIHKPNTCNEEGWSRDTASATLHSSAWGCGADEFRKGSKCYACPNNTEKVAFLGVFNPKQTRACKGQPWICSEGEVAPMPHTALQKIGPPVQGYCVDDGFDFKETAKRHARQQVSLDIALKQAAADFVAAALRNDQLRRALRSKDASGAVAIVYAMPEFHALKNAGRARGFESFSIGSVVDVQAGYGANQEIGFIKDWDGVTKVYTTTGVSAGLALGGDVGLSLGLWKKPVLQLSGYGHGVAVSADVGLSVGAAAWFDFFPVNLVGVSFMGGAGLGLELGEYNQVVTMLYDPDTPVAVR